MSSVHCVVVWEWQCGGQWLPHSPGVSRTLERAHAKKLTRVVLADAEPALRGHYVNLRTLTQSSDNPDGGEGESECAVRRACYSVQSAAGRGAGWAWSAVAPPPRRADLHYEPLSMEIQCHLEEAWSIGSDAVSFEGWSASLQHMTARRGGAVRLLRRAPQPPYPLARSAAPPPPVRRPQEHVEARRVHIPQQHTGSSVHSIQSVRSVQSGHSIQSAHSIQSRHSIQSGHSIHSAHSMQSGHSVHSQQSGHSVQSAPAATVRSNNAHRSESPKDRKPGLARQILHNLNIFNHTKASASSGVSDGASGDELSDEPRARRHSVDTVSTYLSHESTHTDQTASVGSLLNCSAGSDDVFECRDEDQPGDEDGAIVGIDSASASLSVFVRSVSCVQWGALCPACLAPLAPPAPPGPAPAPPPAVALRCTHTLHLHCLNRLLQQQRANQEPLRIECLVCGRVYRSSPPPAAPSPPSPAPAGAAGGEQPAGSMAWALQPGALPVQPPHHHHILVTYNFQSGVQGARHPAPGAPYYAVGFPRHSLLPDTPQGRQVLSLLRRAWEARLLFTVTRSQTTGREHVVSWRAPPPPACRQHYEPPRRPAAHLATTIDALRSLLESNGNC